MAQLILLNGTSSAGKTTLAKALQNQLGGLYLHLSIDHFIFALPNAYLNPPLWSDVFTYHYNGPTLKEIKAGPRGHQLANAMHAAIAATADNGFNVIIDHVLLDQRWLADAVAAFVRHQVMFIGLHCPAEVLDQREQTRGDRTVGQARAQLQAVHQGKLYDLQVDTAQHSPQECVELIQAHLSSGQPNTAFQRLREQFYLGRKCES